MFKVCSNCELIKDSVLTLSCNCCNCTKEISCSCKFCYSCSLLLNKCYFCGISIKNNEEKLSTNKMDVSNGNLILSHLIIYISIIIFLCILFLGTCLILYYITNDVSDKYTYT